MKNETARREVESLDYYLQYHTVGYSEESHMAMMMAIKALDQEDVLGKIEEEINSPNRGTCDYFIVDRIEEIINKYRKGGAE